MGRKQSKIIPVESSKPIRVGLIGAGANTRLRHIPGFQALEGVDILAVANRSLESAKAVAEEFGIPKAYRFPDEVLQDPDIDAVCIGTWPNAHLRYFKIANEMDIHVLCEARMAMDFAQALTMFRSRHKMKLKASFGPFSSNFLMGEMPEGHKNDPEKLVSMLVPSPFTLRYDEAIINLLREEKLGDLLALEISDNLPKINEKTQVSWRDDFECSGKNMLTLGIWYEAVLRWLGDSKSVSAYGYTKYRFRPDSKGRKFPIRYPDLLDVSGEMECGIPYHFRISRLHEETGWEVRIFGTKGKLVLRKERLSLELNGKSPIEIQVPKGDCWRVEEEFINAIRDIEEVKFTRFEDGIRYMAFTEAVWESMQSGYRLPTRQFLDQVVE